MALLNTQAFNKIYLCQGDIVNLEVDAVVNAGMSMILGRNSTRFNLFHSLFFL